MRVDRQQLLATLEAVAQSVSRKPSFEQAHCLAFDESRVLAFDGELCCSSATPLPGIEGAVPAQTLLDYLRNLTAEEVTVKNSDSLLKISGKDFRLKLAMQEEILLPLAQIEKPSRWQTLPDDCLEALTLAADCCGDDDKFFEGTCVHVKDGCLEAFDGEQMLRHETALTVPEPFLLSKKAAKLSQQMGMTKFSLTSRWAHFANGADFSLSALRFVGADYPDLSGGFAPGGETITLPKGLEATAELAAFAAKQADEKALLLVSLREGEVRVKGQGVTAEYEERRKAKYSGPPITFRIGAKLLASLAAGHGEASVTAHRLLVDGGRWQYAVRLYLPEESS